MKSTELSIAAYVRQHLANYTTKSFAYEQVDQQELNSRSAQLVHCNAGFDVRTVAVIVCFTSHFTAPSVILTCFCRIGFGTQNYTFAELSNSRDEVQNGTKRRFNARLLVRSLVRSRVLYLVRMYKTGLKSNVLCEQVALSYCASAVFLSKLCESEMLVGRNS